jgi:hypothetical protein
LEKEELQHKELEITAYISSYHPSRSSYDKEKGFSLEMRIEGHVDDPFVDPIGDIYENERGSNFSRAPISINIQLDNNGIHKEWIEASNEDAIGGIDIRKNVELRTFELNGKEYTDHPIRVSLSLPAVSFNAIEERLKNNKEAGKLGMITFRVIVEKNLLVEDFDNSISDWLPLELKDLDVTKEKLNLPVYKYTFGQTVQKIDQNTNIERRVKVIPPEAETSTHLIELEKLEWSFNSETGIYENINIIGKTKKFPNQAIYYPEPINQYQNVSIKFEEFWMLSEDPFINSYELPKESIYGRFNYYSELNDLDLRLAYHPKDFDDLIRPLLRMDNLKDILLRVQLEKKLELGTDQKGTVLNFSVHRINQEEIVTEYDGKKIFEELVNLENKVSNSFKQTEERLVSVEKAIKHASEKNIYTMSGIMKQIDKPNDVISRILFKIPIISSILRFLAK